MISAFSSLPKYLHGPSKATFLLKDPARIWRQLQHNTASDATFWRGAWILRTLSIYLSIYIYIYMRKKKKKKLRWSEGRTLFVFYSVPCCLAVLVRWRKQCVWRIVHTKRREVVCCLKLKLCTLFLSLSTLCCVTLYIWNGCTKSSVTLCG